MKLGVIDVALIPQVMQELEGKESTGDESDATLRERDESSGDESDYTSRTLNYELDSVDSDCETRDTSPEAVP